MTRVEQDLQGCAAALYKAGRVYFEIMERVLGSLHIVVVRYSPVYCHLAPIHAIMNAKKCPFKLKSASHTGKHLYSLLKDMQDITKSFYS